MTLEGKLDSNKKLFENHKALLESKGLWLDLTTRKKLYEFNFEINFYSYLFIASVPNSAEASEKEEQIENMYSEIENLKKKIIKM